MAWWNAHPEAVNHKSLREFTCQTCGRCFESYGKRERKFCFSSLLWRVKVGAGMNKQQAIIHYYVAMSVIAKWLAAGILSAEEFTKLESLLADKYGLPKAAYTAKTLAIIGF